MDNDSPTSGVYARSNMPWNHGISSEPSPLKQMLDAMAEADDETRAEFALLLREYALKRWAPPEERNPLRFVSTDEGTKWQVPPPGTVYYIKFSDRVKIGFTTNLEKRLQAIPHDEVLATEPGTMAQEKARHAEFAELRVVGEWFRYEEPLVSHIASLAS